MRDWAGKRYWLVGASEGLGRALAHAMSRAGVSLVLSARSRERLEELAAELPGKAEALPMDIADDASVAEAAEALGEVDGIVLIAAVYWPMKAGEWDAGRAVAMADINFTGTFRALGAVMPGFNARGQGHVVIIGSLAGFRGLPGAVGYGASKAGVMSLAETMYCDLRGSGIDVQVVNPGYIKTRTTDLNDFRMPFIMEPEEAARRVFDHMNSGRFKTSFPLLFSLVFRIAQFLPDAIYYRIFSKAG